MFLFRKKNKTTEPPLGKRAKAMPYTKKVQFCYLDIAELKAMLTEDINSVTTLEPVNYYAEKNKFYQCVFSYDEGYENIIMRFELYENDRKTQATDYYEIDKQLYAKILLRFGQRVNI